jgi:hypothetical protein
VRAAAGLVLVSAGELSPGLWATFHRAGGGVRSGVHGAAETEVIVPGQLALVIETETVVPAAVWETLPPEHQLQVALRLARLLARLVEAARDE